MHGHVSVTDFRTLGKIPEGNRFLVYSLFPDAVASVTIGFTDETREKVMVRGGHAGAGSCSFHVDRANEYIPQIIDALLKN